MILEFELSMLRMISPSRGAVGLAFPKHEPEKRVDNFDNESCEVVNGRHVPKEHSTWILRNYK